MVIGKVRRDRRRGATVVETALVLLPLLTLLFGIFEYGRLLLDWNLLNNAAREGCRYALANNTNITINADVQGVVTSYMAGRNASFTNFTVTVSGTHSGVSTPVNNLAPGDPITVTVSGKYRFMNIIPLVSMPSLFSLTGSVTMICEGGT
ncbi:MAG TPA: TadE/TadG family type IV pilus assembly protein [Gemmataceae bacterium]|nr:TadE/TadG family type IV pilus assembly protein [Gemmataceae bacterium]